MDRFEVDFVADEDLLAKVRAIAADEGVVSSGVKTIRPVGGRNAPISSEDLITILKVVTAILQAGAAGAVFLTKVRDLLGSRDQLTVKAKGRKPLDLTKRTTDEQIQAFLGG